MSCFNENYREFQIYDGVILHLCQNCIDKAAKRQLEMEFEDAKNNTP